MSFLSDLRTYILADATVAGLIGTQMYGQLVPHDATVPFLVFQQISDPRLHTHDGDSGLAHPRIQITSWDGGADGYAGALALAAAVKARINSTTGTIGSTTGCAVLLDNEADMADIDPRSEERRLFGRRQDYICWHQE